MVNLLNKVVISCILVISSTLIMNSRDYTWEVIDEYYPYGTSKTITWTHIKVLDSNHILLLGKNWEQNVEIRYTNNGGESWTSRILEAGYFHTDSATGKTRYIEPSYVGLIYFISPTKLIMQCGDGYYWFSQGSLDSLKKIKLDLPGYIECMKPITDSLLEGITNEGYYIKSSDGGYNWDIVKKYKFPDSLIISSFDCWQLISSSEIMVKCFLGYEIGEFTTNIIKTTDGGDTWQVIKEEDPEVWVDYIYFMDNKTGWYTSTTEEGIYSHNMIHKTTDGGNSWVKQFDSILPNATLKYGDIRFNDSLNGVVIGDLCKIIRTTDGGKNWKYIKEYYDDDISGEYPFFGWLSDFGFLNNHQFLGIITSEPVVLKFSFDLETDISYRDIQNKSILYPNPAFSYITLDFNKIDKTTMSYAAINSLSDYQQIEIYNLMGVLVKSMPIVSNLANSGRVKIDINDLPIGCYLLKVGNRLERFVKM
ncbi:MAG TPA: hypothetical protein PLE30_00315 [Candidatus Kapabacteria bacterium]|nr:hypothetical protein [Candidatus Kapabacteria bacterium]